MISDPLIEKALDFAKLSLAGKKRYSGEEFIDHTLKVEMILEKYDVTDPVTLAAAILHHTLSDSAATSQDIEKEFGNDIGSIIETLETLRVIKIGETNNTEFIENLRKMFLVLAKDLRIVLIKLADILDNLRTLEFTPKEKQLEVARETIEIFAPLAERLGIGEMKGSMQDLAFPYAFPEDYEKTKKLLKINTEKLDKKLLKIKIDLKTILDKEKIPYRIESRTKHLYSLYTKLKRPEINFDISKIYDLVAFRVIVKTEQQCYEVLDIIHKLWKPLPNRFYDFITQPKPNGYQSLHTTVLGPDGHPFEIQIRTEKMHEDAEFGVAAHWHYTEKKEGNLSDEQISKGFSTDTAKLAWVKSLSTWQEEIVDNEEFLKTVKTDFFGARIFVFTPKGDVKDLPLGATPIDFAYTIHTTLGDKAMGAKVNSKMVPLDFQLKNGDVVEIQVSKDKNKKPNRDWLNFCVTSMAKREIKKAYK